MIRVDFCGYIDESFGPEQNLFALSCLIARSSDWLEMQRKWEQHLEGKNKQLTEAGRTTISRYHASDCSGRKREFRDWSLDERDHFVRGLFSIFKSVGVHAVVFDVSLNELCEVFPEWASDRLAAGYGVLTNMLLYLIGQDFKHFFGENAPAKIALFHDQTGGQGKYDPTILRSFEAQMAKPDFPYRDQFTTITPVTWQDCIPLQPADLVAFECYKQSQARAEARASRKSFKALLDLEAFGIHSKTFQREALVKFREAAEREGKLPTAPQPTA
jgi:hypothetical protein